MSFSNIPVAKRTRSQMELRLQLLAQGSKRRKRDEVTVDKSYVDHLCDENGSKRRKHDQVNMVYKSSVDECDEDENGSQVPSRSTVKLEKSNNLDESSHDVSTEEETNGEGFKIPSVSTVKIEKSNDLDEVSLDKSKYEETNGKEPHLSPDESDRIESTEITLTENSYESDPETSSVDSSESDDSDSDYAGGKEEVEVVVEEEEEEEEEGSKGSCRSTTRKLYKLKTVDKSSSDESEDEKDHKNGSRVPSRATVQLRKSNILDEFSLDKSKDEESDGEESRLSLEVIDGIEIIDITRKHKGYGSANSLKTKTQVYLVDSSDDSEEGSKGSCRSTKINFEKEKPNENGSGATIHIEKSNNLDESSVAELSSDEESSGKESHLSLKETDGLEEIGNVKSASKGYGLATPFKNGTHRYFFYSSDDSDSNETDNIRDESSVVELSNDEESSAEESHLSLKKTDGLEKIGNVKSASKGYGLATPFKNGTHTYFFYSSDDSDSDETDNIRDESSVVELSNDEESSAEESHLSLKETDELEEIGNVKSASKGYGLATPFKNGTHTYFFYSSDDSDPDETDNIRDESSVVELSNDEESSVEESHFSLKETYGLEEIGNDKYESKGYGSASPFKTGTHTYFFYSSDNSDSDDTDNIRDEQEDENLQKSCKGHLESLNNLKAGSFQSTKDNKDEPFSSSESESDKVDDVKMMNVSAPVLAPLSPNQSLTKKQSPIKNVKEKDNHSVHKTKIKKVDKKTKDELSDISDNEKTSAKDKVWAGSADRKEKSHLGDKTHMKKNDKKPNDESSDVNDNEKRNAKDKVWDGSDDRKEKNHSGHKKHMKKKNKKSNDEPSDVNDNEKTNAKDKFWDGSDDRKEKNHPGHKTNMKKNDKKPVDESDAINVHKKTNANDKVNCVNTKVDEENVSKNQKSKKGGLKDDGGSVNAMLDSITGKESVHEKEGDDCLPLKFRFDDSEDESSSQETNDFGAKGLFEEMEFALDCNEIGSYKTPTVKNQEKDAFNDNDNNDDTETNQAKCCQNGNHRDIYFEEQTGMRCRLCGAVILESRYVIPTLANYAATNRSKRSYLFYEQLDSNESMYFKDWDSNHHDICKKTKGTVWELIPKSIQAHLYPHQQEGFEFLWKNLTGTIDLSRLHNIGSRGSCGGGGGGCIISHAPGTGKTLLTIVFMESFLKRFPKCCPVIVAPASMLLTWEAEFRKWQVGFSFLNLNNMVKSHSKCNNDLIRASKIMSWSNGGSVLGVSYNLYGKIAGDTKMKNSIFEKMGNVLLDMPGLVVLDEGHTPRNQNSNIWNTFLKLKTKNRVILSGTPFQNNFRELFNTLGLVRPATTMNEKYFADMIHQNNRKKSGGTSTSEDIEMLKVIIKPFVHVHEGLILESKLPGLKQTVVLLNPSSFQKGFIEILGKIANTFEYEHKVALVSVHPSLIVHCTLSEKEQKSTNKQELENVRLHPELGAKTRFVMELIRLSESLHEKVLIFSQYTQPLKLLKDQIALTFGWKVEREIEVIKGRTIQKLRQKIINNFNDPKGKVKVLLASTKCCSEGIHLIGASRVVLLDVVWNPSVERQAISRAYRLGQKKVVYTYHLMTAGTTEEEKYDRQIEKGRLAKMVFSSAGEETNKKVTVDGIDDKVLEQMVGHQELEDMFKKITYLENEKRKAD